MANQTIANLVHETNFNSVYQQGEKFSMFVMCVDENCLLVVIFKAQVSVGAVKYFATPAVERMAEATENRPGTRSGRRTGFVRPQRRGPERVV